MATHKSAIKRHRQNLKRRARNVGIKSTIRTAMRHVKESIAKGNKESAAAALKQAIRLLDTAVSKGALHRNNASRKISHLSKTVAQLS